MKIFGSTLSLIAVLVKSLVKAMPKQAAQKSVMANLAGLACINFGYLAHKHYFTNTFFSPVSVSRSERRTCLLKLMEMQDTATLPKNISLGYCVTGACQTIFGPPIRYS